MWDDDEEEDGNWDPMEGIFTGASRSSSSTVEAPKSDSPPDPPAMPVKAPAQQEFGEVKVAPARTLPKEVVEEHQVDPSGPVTLMKATAKAKAAPAVPRISPACRVEDRPTLDTQKMLTRMDRKLRKTQKKMQKKKEKRRERRMRGQERKMERKMEKGKKANETGSYQSAGGHQRFQVYAQHKRPSEENRRHGPSGRPGAASWFKKPRMMPRGVGKTKPSHDERRDGRHFSAPPPVPAAFRVAHVVQASHSVKSMKDVQHHDRQQTSNYWRQGTWEGEGLPRNKVSKVPAAALQVVPNPPNVVAPQEVRQKPKAGTNPPPTEAERGDHKDCFGRDFKLNEVVVNFANVGHYYGIKVLGQQPGKDGFDWEGVRRCVRYLKAEAQMKVTGVITENFVGFDNRLKQVALPADIKKMCESVEETPRVTGRNHTSADDEMTIKCAYRRACRFLDNDNYREWMIQLGDAKARTWLQNHRELVHMRYYFDRGLGIFDLLSGNYPVTSLATNDTIEKRNLSRMGRG